MAKPIKTQMANRAHVAKLNEIIMRKHVKIPKSGTSGTSGVLKGRGRSGRVFRKTITLAHTIANARSVPMLVKCPTKDNGAKAEKSLQRPSQPDLKPMVYDTYDGQLKKNGEVIHLLTSCKICVIAQA